MEKVSDQVKPTLCDFRNTLVVCPKCEGLNRVALDKAGGAAPIWNEAKLPTHRSGSGEEKL